MSFHLPHPAAWAIGGLVFAADAASQLGGVLSDVLPPTTIVGAVIVADRVLQRSRNDALRLARETAADASARLDAEQERWDEKVASYEHRIAELEEEVVRYRRLAFGIKKEETDE